MSTSTRAVGAEPIRAERIAELQRPWRSINRDGTLFATPEWLECNESGARGGVQYRFFPGSEAGMVIRRLEMTTFPGDNPLHCLLTERLDPAAEADVLERAQALRAELEPLRSRLYPIATCGLPGGYLPGIIGPAEPEGYAGPLAELGTVGREWQCPLTAVAHVPDDHPMVPALRRHGYIGVPGLPQTIFDVRQESFDDYVARLPGSHRRKVKREWRVFHENDLTLRELDLAEFGPEHAALHARQLRKYGHHISDQWLIDLVRRSAEYLGQWATLIVAERHSRPEAFVLCYEYGGQLHPKMSGFSPHAETCYGYFVLGYYKLMLKAQQRGVREIVYGPGSYPAKIARGCRLASRTTFLRPVDESLAPSIRELATIVQRASSWRIQQGDV